MNMTETETKKIEARLARHREELRSLNNQIELIRGVIGEIATTLETLSEVSPRMTADIYEACEEAGIDVTQ